MEPQEASTCLLPLFVIHMWCYHHGSQRATGDVSWWQDIFMLFSGTGSGFCPRFTGAELGLWEFSHHCQSHYKSLQWWEKFPQIQFCSSESGTESRSCAWEKYKYILPPAHILSCSLTAMVITSHMNGKQRGESQVPGNRVIKQLISSAPMSTHLKGGGDLEPLSCSVAVKRATSHLSQFCSFWL